MPGNVFHNFGLLTLGKWLNNVCFTIWIVGRLMIWLLRGQNTGAKAPPKKNRGANSHYVINFSTDSIFSCTSFVVIGLLWFCYGTFEIFDFLCFKLDCGQL